MVAQFLVELLSVLAETIRRNRGPLSPFEQRRITRNYRNRQMEAFVDPVRLPPLLVPEAHIPGRGFTGIQAAIARRPRSETNHHRHDRSVDRRRESTANP